jgi:hypothetical protein
MDTKLEVSRGPRGLRVHLPSGRTLDIRADESGVRFLERMLRDADENAHYERKGYLRGFPTQHVVDLWQREDKNRALLAEQIEEAKQRKSEERASQWRDRGIELSALDFDL